MKLFNYTSILLGFIIATLCTIICVMDFEDQPIKLEKNSVLSIILLGYIVGYFLIKQGINNITK